MSKNYINVSRADVQKVKKHVFSLPIYQQGRYRSLLNALSNNFYGATKSLTDKELAQYNAIVGEKGIFKFKAR
ncbi:MAG: hypothetical protein IJ437_04490 [Clostridia bacterium]|nr:hypothetical protein [Clostridia bacterium]